MSGRKRISNQSSEIVKIEPFIQAFIQACDWTTTLSQLLLSRVEKCTDKFRFVKAVIDTIFELDEDDSNIEAITSVSGEKALLAQFAKYLLTDKEAFDYCLENIVNPLGQWSVLLEILTALENNFDTHYEFSKQFINCKQTGQFWTIVAYNKDFDDKYLSLFNLYKSKWFKRQCHIQQFKEIVVSWNLKCAFLLEQISFEDSVLRSILLTEIVKFNKN
jgi:hypothetical protein